MGLGLLNCPFFSIDCYVVFGQAEIGIPELLPILILKAVELGHAWIADLSDGGAGGWSMIFSGVMVVDVRGITSTKWAVAALVVVPARIGRPALLTAHLSS